MPLDELESTVVEGDYQIALLPFSPSSEDCVTFLQQFADGAFTGWESAGFDSQLRQLAGQLAPDAGQIAQAEQTLLAGGAIAPLWYQDQARTGSGRGACGVRSLRAGAGSHLGNLYGWLSFIPRSRAPRQARFFGRAGCSVFKIRPENSLRRSFVRLFSFSPGKEEPPCTAPTANIPPT